MTGSKISLNIHAQGVKNTPRLLTFMQRTQPRWGLVMDGVGLARQIKGASPNTNVICRQYRPDGYWYQRSPDDYLTFMDQQMGDFDEWCYVENEAGLFKTDQGVDILDWNIRLIQTNEKRPKPRKLVILNLSVGTPEAEDWPTARALLELCNTYRDHVVIGLHEYFNAVITSGFIGGPPIEEPYHPDYTRVANWPAKDEVQGLTKFHCGRFMFLVNACQKMGITVPRLVLTEHGADDVSDVKGWTDTLPRTPPYTDIRGFKTLTAWWAQMYGKQWSSDQTYAEMLTYGAENIYADSPVEGGCIYCYGHVDSDWEPDDVEGHEEFLTLLEAYAQKAVTMPVETKPILIPKPNNAITPRRVRVKNTIHVRFGPQTSFRNIAYPAGTAELQNGTIATLWLDSKNSDGAGRDWVYVNIHTGDFANQQGWVSLTDLKYEDKTATQEIPQQQPPDEPSKPVESQPASNTNVPPKADRVTYYNAIADHYQELANTFRSLALLG